jgi:hypothetical protein
MGVCNKDEIIYSLCFADEQVVIVENKDVVA